MDLRTRLARLDSLQRPAAAPPAATAAVREETLRGAGLAPMTNAAGTVWYRQTCCRLEPPDLRHLVPPVLLHPLPGGTAPEQVLLLDVETSGLAGGTGTVAFLVGLGWWKNDHLVVRQLMLPGPGTEAALLGELSRIAARFRVVVTYNGNRFDLPLLHTRTILARCEGLPAHLISWDLLPSARRLWGRRLSDCRQGSVERAVGHHRPHADLPGSMIPAVWQTFVREGRGERLPDVLLHNERDMVGMAKIATAVAESSRRLTSPRPDPSPLPWQDCWALARLAERNRDHKRASVWITRALAAAGRRPGERSIAPPENLLRDAVRLLKRTAQPAEVADLLDSARRWYGPRFWLEREAAIVWEHRLGDPARALEHAQRLGDPHRLARLRRKLACAGGSAGAAVAEDPKPRGDCYERSHA